MRDDYLWDGSGEPDPEVQKLESVLGQLRHNRPAPAFPEISSTRKHVRPRIFDISFWSPVAQVAAAILVVAALVVTWQRWKPAPAAWSGWDVTRVGVPGEKGKLAFGQVLETDNRSQATIRAEDVGEVEMDPGTRLGLLKSKA